MMKGKKAMVVWGGVALFVFLLLFSALSLFSSSSSDLLSSSSLSDNPVNNYNNNNNNNNNNNINNNNNNNNNNLMNEEEGEKKEGGWEGMKISKGNEVYMEGAREKKEYGEMVEELLYYKDQSKNETLMEEIYEKYFPALRFNGIIDALHFTRHELVSSSVKHNLGEYFFHKLSSLSSPSPPPLHFAIEVLSRNRLTNAPLHSFVWSSLSSFLSSSLSSHFPSYHQNDNMNNNMNNMNMNMNRDNNIGDDMNDNINNDNINNNINKLIMKMRSKEERKKRGEEEEEGGEHHHGGGGEGEGLMGEWKGGDEEEERKKKEWLESDEFLDQLFQLVDEDLCYFKSFDFPDVNIQYESCLHGVGHGLSDLFPNDLPLDGDNEDDIDNDNDNEDDIDNDNDNEDDIDNDNDNEDDIDNDNDNEDDNNKGELKSMRICERGKDNDFKYLCGTGVYMDVNPSYDDHQTYAPCDVNLFPAACFRFLNPTFSFLHSLHLPHHPCALIDDRYYQLGCVWGFTFSDREKKHQTIPQYCSPFLVPFLPSFLSHHNDNDNNEEEEEMGYKNRLLLACVDGYVMAVVNKAEARSICHPLKGAVENDHENFFMDYCYSVYNSSSTSSSSSSEDYQEESEGAILWNYDLLEFDFDPTYVPRSIPLPQKKF